MGMKAGIVALIGRPNVGKSTFLNNILGQKVSVTSPKPQTTRFNIQAVYEDSRGQIIFIDTPGIFAKVVDTLARRINEKAKESLTKDVDLVIYMVDHTRQRSIEENKNTRHSQKSYRTEDSGYQQNRRPGTYVYCPI